MKSINILKKAIWLVAMMMSLNFSLLSLAQAQNGCSQQQMQMKVIQSWPQVLSASNPPAYIPLYHFPVPTQEHRRVAVDVRDVCIDGGQLKSMNRVSVCYDANMNDPDYFANGFCFNSRQVTLSMSLADAQLNNRSVWIPSQRLSQWKDHQQGGIILVGTEGNFLDSVSSNMCLAYRYDIPKCQ